MLTNQAVVKMLSVHAERLQSQAELARLVGCSRAFINDILKGKREPSGKVLKFLGVERRVLYAKTK